MGDTAGAGGEGRCPRRYPQIKPLRGTCPACACPPAPRQPDGVKERRLKLGLLRLGCGEGGGAPYLDLGGVPEGVQLVLALVQLGGLCRVRLPAQLHLVALPCMHGAPLLLKTSRVTSDVLLTPIVHINVACTDRV